MFLGKWSADVWSLLAALELESLSIEEGIGFKSDVLAESHELVLSEHVIWVLFLHHLEH